MYKAELKKEIDDAFSEMQELTKKVGDWLKIFNKTAHDEEILNRIRALQKQWLISAKRYKQASMDFYGLLEYPYCDFSSLRLYSNAIFGFSLN